MSAPKIDVKDLVQEMRVESYKDLGLNDKQIKKILLNKVKRSSRSPPKVAGKKMKSPQRKLKSKKRK